MPPPLYWTFLESKNQPCSGHHCISAPTAVPSIVDQQNGLTAWTDKLTCTCSWATQFQDPKRTQRPPTGVQTVLLGALGWCLCLKAELISARWPRIFPTHPLSPGVALKLLRHLTSTARSLSICLRELHKYYQLLCMPGSEKIALKGT